MIRGVARSVKQTHRQMDTVTLIHNYLMSDQTSDIRHYSESITADSLSSRRATLWGKSKLKQFQCVDEIKQDILKILDIHLKVKELLC